MNEERKDRELPLEEVSAGQTDEGPSLPFDLEGGPDIQGSADQATASEREQLMEALQRTQADFVNYKRRTEEDREEQIRYSNSRLILKLLPVVDEFVLAIDHASKAGSEPSWLEGISLIQRKLHSLLESENVTRIQAEGKEFDPFEHEAMAYQESTDYQEGHILTVVREGYKIQDRVIRPALVILAKKPEIEVQETVPSAGKETEDA